jgi:hypothetical protein
MPIPSGPTFISGTTLGQWIGMVRDHLEGDSTEEANQLDGDYTASSGTITLRHNLGNIAEGATISIGTNTLRVMGVNTLTKTATVAGGMRGSMDTSASDGSMVLVNPRFTDYQIMREINNHLGVLSSPEVGLYQVASVELPVTTVTEGYDLAGLTGFIKPLDVRRQTYGPSMAWPSIESTWWDVYETAPSDFASGRALRVRGVDNGLNIQLIYSKEFDGIAADTATLVSTTGIPDTAEDIPPLGAAISLMAGREVARNNLRAQGSSRRADEVPPGAIGRSYQGLVAWWQTRVVQELSRLRQLHPVSW